MTFLTRPDVKDDDGCTSVGETKRIMNLFEFTVFTGKKFKEMRKFLVAYILHLRSVLKLN